MKKWKENFVIYSLMSFFLKLSSSLRFDYKLTLFNFYLLFIVILGFNKKLDKLVLNTN